jgi:hypothetical protein
MHNTTGRWLSTLFTCSLAIVAGGCQCCADRPPVWATHATTGPAADQVAAATTPPASGPTPMAPLPSWPDDRLLDRAVRRLFADHPEDRGKLIFVGVSFGDPPGRQADPPPALLKRLADLPIRVRPFSGRVQPRTQEQARESWHYDPLTGEAGLNYFVNVTGGGDGEWFLDIGRSRGLVDGGATGYRATRLPGGDWQLTPTGRVVVF